MEGQWEGFLCVYGKAKLGLMDTIWPETEA
jgi:hypothetical protein